MCFLTSKCDLLCKFKAKLIEMNFFFLCEMSSTVLIRAINVILLWIIGCCWFFFCHRKRIHFDKIGMWFVVNVMNYLSSCTMQNVCVVCIMYSKQCACVHWKTAWMTWSTRNKLFFSIIFGLSSDSNPKNFVNKMKR